ncbi:hypothetical protein P8C59_004414 [Phyllachora maydis]|uniref:Uncharacterized protein n=1 Tax=Phyllachora maydis TaxID=1825666 RepID=A0AAD9MCF3_9PEZI|nr:hypothetical protein P8C59_004414 [Phyllachora maydis]
MIAVRSFFPTNFFSTLRTIIDRPSAHDRQAISGSVILGDANMAHADPAGVAPPPKKGCRARRVKIIRPEADSIYDILHDHAGESLHTPPLCWTDRHIELLGVNFQELETVRTPMPEADGIIVYREPTRMASSIADLLNSVLRHPPRHITTQSAILKDVMSKLFPGSMAKSRQNTDLDMFLEHDAHYAAVLLAMAQAHCYDPLCVQAAKEARSLIQKPLGGVLSRRPLKIPPPKLRDVTVQLLTHDEDQPDATFVVYTAVVSSDFLARFAHPERAPPGLDEARLHMRITFQPVNVFPLIGLKERLAKVLSPAFTGEPRALDPERITFYDSLVASEHRVQHSPSPSFTNSPALFSQDVERDVDPAPLLAAQSLRRPPAVVAALGVVSVIGKRKRLEPTGLDFMARGFTSWASSSEDECEDSECGRGGNSRASEDVPVSPDPKRIRVEQSVVSSLEVC